MDTTTVFAEITKSEKQDDGTLLVTGIATSPALDIDKQICDPVWLGKAMPRWFSTGGNVREQHQNIAAGVATEYAEKDGGIHEITALVVDPGSVLKVEKKVLKGFSIGIRGPRIIADKAAPGGRIVDGEVVEVSLVDRPANPECMLTLAKAATEGVEISADRFDEARQLVRVEELVEKTTGPGETTPAGDSGAAPAGAGEGAEGAASGGGADATAAVSPPAAGDGDGKAAETGPLDVTPVDPTTAEGDEAAADASRDAGFTVDDITSAVVDAVQGLLRTTLPDLVKRDYTDKDRKRMAGQGQAMTGGGFPIKTVADLKNAIQAVGRAKNPAAAKAHIEARAKALGRDDLIPDAWKGDAGKAAGTDEMAHDPAVLQQVRDGLLNLIIAEAREALQGEREEYDLAELLSALAMFLQWWDGETYEGEAPAVSDTKTATADATKAVDIDATKAAATVMTATDAVTETTGPADAAGTDSTDSKAATADTVKAVADAIAPLATGLAELRAGNEALMERLERVEKAAAPGGPVRARTHSQEKAAGVNEAVAAMRAKAAALRATAASIEDRGIQAEFEKRAKAVDDQLAVQVAALTA